ncbi:uncharacterized protein LOC128295142 [Gossypium arboreum]|nr:uncharacterized protein LOC128295142 [Gossypium arboreum]
MTKCFGEAAVYNIALALNFHLYFSLLFFRYEEGEAKVKTEKDMRFWKLEKLQLENLPTLTTFNPVDYSRGFLLLTSLKMTACKSLATKSKKPVSASLNTAYAETDGALLPEPKKSEVKFRRSVEIVEIPSRNRDITWSAEMKIN